MEDASESDFQKLLSQICAGDKSAARELIRAYSPYLQIAVRKRLKPALRRRYDSSDLIQMVWLTLFRDPETLTKFRKKSDLLRYLQTVTRNKFVTELRRSRKTSGADYRRELPLDDVTEGSRRELRGNDPTPSQIMMARERYRRIIERHRRRDRQIIRLRRIGNSCEEIAERLGTHVSTIRRALLRMESQHAPQTAE